MLRGSTPPERPRNPLSSDRPVPGHGGPHHDLCQQQTKWELPGIGFAAPGRRLSVALLWRFFRSHRAGRRSPLWPLKTRGQRQANKAVHGVIRILRAKPSTQDQQQPVELHRTALEVKALTSDCDSRELVGVAVFPQVEIDYSVWHATSCLRNLKTSSGSSSYRYGKFG